MNKAKPKCKIILCKYTLTVLEINQTKSLARNLMRLKLKMKLKFEVKLTAKCNEICLY